MEIEMTGLSKTWILDLDGTLLKHNGYKTDGEDTLLEGAYELFKQIREQDMVIIVTSRTEEYKALTEEFLAKNHIRYNSIIYNAPYGERILINDRKPSGRDMAFAINTDRDVITDLAVRINSEL